MKAGLLSGRARTVRVLTAAATVTGVLAVGLLSAVAQSSETSRPTQPGRAEPVRATPVPPSAVIQGLEWHWETYRTAAPGSDLWPFAWGPDDHLYTAWGDGGGFGGTDSDGRVAMGIARLEGGPEDWRAFNVNGGKNPEHPATFAKKGKTAGLAFVNGVLYATVNLQDGKWPDVNHALEWSTDRGATWSKTGWLFPKGVGNFQPAVFLSFGRDYTGVPGPLAGYVYLYGPKQSPGGAAAISSISHACPVTSCGNGPPTSSSREPMPPARRDGAPRVPRPGRYLSIPTVWRWVRWPMTRG